MYCVDWSPFDVFVHVAPLSVELPTEEGNPNAPYTVLPSTPNDETYSLDATPLVVCTQVPPLFDDRQMPTLFPPAIKKLPLRTMELNPVAAGRPLLLANQVDPKSVLLNT
jgi:hypothetical protein